ncbi:MAG TPA: SPOR domain-containing protein [Stellaceae bacterium]
MSTFEDTMELSPRRRLFTSRRRLRGRHILGGVLIAGAATAALSAIGHHDSSPTLPQHDGTAALTAHFSTVQQPAERILAEPQAATAAAPIELTPPQPRTAPATGLSLGVSPPPTEKNAAVLDAGVGTGRITTGLMPLSAATRWTQTPELAQAAAAADTAAAAAAVTEPSASEPAAAASAAAGKSSVKPAGAKPAAATHAASASGGRKQPTPAGAPAPRAAAPATAAGGWRIQLAAVRSEAAANDTWGRLKQAHPDLLGSLRPTTSRAVLDGAGPVFRVQAGGFHDRGGADRLCNALKRHDVACLTVSPR